MNNNKSEQKTVSIEDILENQVVAIKHIRNVLDNVNTSQGARKLRNELMMELSGVKSKAEN